jgi:hypothetical protein
MINIFIVYCVLLDGWKKLWVFLLSSFGPFWLEWLNWFVNWHIWALCCIELINFVFTVLNAHALSSSDSWNVLRFRKLIGDVVQLYWAPDCVKKAISFLDFSFYSINAIEISCEVIENSFARQNLITRWSLLRIDLKTPLDSLL